MEAHNQLKPARSTGIGKRQCDVVLRFKRPVERVVGASYRRCRRPRQYRERPDMEVAPLLLGLAAIASAAGFWFAVEGKNYRLRTPVSPD